MKKTLFKKECRGVIVLLSILILSVLIILTFMDYSLIIDDFYVNEDKKKEVINYFYENKSLVEESIRKNNYKEIEKRGVYLVVDCDDFIRFICQIEGAHYGFIYSLNNDIDKIVPPSAQPYRKKKSNNGYKYLHLNGDNNFYIEKIENNYYYYEEEW